MSNGPFGQLDCRCGAVSLLLCGVSLGSGLDEQGQPVTFWPLEAIQVGQGADEIDVSPDTREGASWRCRRCLEALLHVHDEAALAVLAGHWDDTAHRSSALTNARQAWLETLGYRIETMS